MNVSRRRFLGALGTGTAAAAALQWPFAARTASALQTSASPRPAEPAILLGSNENAYGPAPRVLEAIREALTSAHRYPDSPRREFTARVAKYHGVSSEQVVIGCGSVEILRVAAVAFTGPRKKLVVASPTFEAISKAAESLGTPVIRVPLNKDFAHDLPEMLAKAGEDAGLVYVCNPNNPTASVTPRHDLEAFISKLPPQTHLLIDEAYHHFAKDRPHYLSFLDRAASSERVIVARTFSKVYGLAGMRLGYGVGSPQTIARMRDLVSMENANVAVLRGAMAALDDEEAMRLSVRRNEADRAEFMKQASLRKLSPIPSHANFAMMDIGRAVPAVIDHFKERGILVGRPFPPLNNYLRVSFGRPEEMRAFWRAWDELKQL